MRALNARLTRAAGDVAILALLAGCHQAEARASACAAPPTWPGPDTRPGQPDRDLAACLQQQAYATRTLQIPAASQTAGVKCAG